MAIFKKVLLRNSCHLVPCISFNANKFLLLSTEDGVPGRNGPSVISPATGAIRGETAFVMLRIRKMEDYLWCPMHVFLPLFLVSDNYLVLVCQPSLQLTIMHGVLKGELIITI